MTQLLTLTATQKFPPQATGDKAKGRRMQGERGMCKPHADKLFTISLSTTLTLVAKNEKERKKSLIVERWIDKETDR